MEESLLEIAEHFGALAVVLGSLVAVHDKDPETRDRIEMARHRALRGADLANAALRRRKIRA